MTAARSRRRALASWALATLLLGVAACRPSGSSGPANTSSNSVAHPVAANAPANAPRSVAHDARQETALQAALDGSAFAVIDVASGRTLAEQRPEWIDTPVWPGSIAKIATLAGALEAGVLTAETRVSCTRHLRLADGRTVDCAHAPLDHPLSIVEALAFSCNVFTATIARTMSPQALTRGFVRLGLPPPPPAPSARDSGDRAAIALGLAGNKVPPRMLLSLMRRASTRSDAAMALVREGLKASARVGTASGFAQAGVDALAKTGTALMPNGKPLGLVIAAWPSDAPREALVLALPGGSGAQAAEVAALLVQRRSPAPAATSGVGGDALGAPVPSLPAPANGAGSEALAGAAFPRASQRDSAGAVAPRRSVAGGADVANSAVRIGIPVVSGYRVETVPFEDYIARVVAGESSSATPEPVREALAITARTYALVNRHRHADDGFDLCTLTHCQVTRPATSESRRAAEQTRGQILVRAQTGGMRSAAPAATDAAARLATPAGDRPRLVAATGAAVPVFYSASCGGSLEDASLVLPDVARGSLSWLTARPDPAGVVEPVWQTDIRAADLLRALQGAGLRGDHLRHLAVERTPSGIVSRVALDGLVPAAISGDEFRRLVGRQLGWEKLKSLRFTVTRTASGYRFDGRGHGHGVGLCVFGASALAARGYSTSQLLEAYFPGLMIASASARASDAASTSTSISASASDADPDPAADTASPSRAGGTTAADGFLAGCGHDGARTDARRVSTSAEASAAAEPTASERPGRSASGGSPAFTLRLPVEDEPARDELRALIAQTIADLGRTMDVAPPSGLAIVFHPTGESYRRATGRPWWTSAATMIERDKTTIHLVPLGALRSGGRLTAALRHELVHALAGPLLRTRPLWVQEGIAAHFAGDADSRSRASAAPRANALSASAPDAACPDDQTFRQARDRAATDRAYRAASACVTRALAAGTAWRDIGAH
jgi:stage II sporulation protein D